MTRYLSFLVACACAATIFFLAPRARADAWEGSVVVVEVTDAASELDADALRALIGRELRAEAVPPTDPRAEAAGGTLTVDVDRDRGELVVTFLGSGEPIDRRVPLPADAQAARRTAAMLAGNLARDEAAELSEQLLRQRRRAPPPTPSAAEIPPEPEPESSRPKPKPAPLHEVRVQGLVGTGTTGLGAGAMVSYRYGAFVVAPSWSTHAGLLNSFGLETWRVGAGTAIAPRRWLRVEILGVGGLHEYTGVGSEPFGSIGADGSRAFLGLWGGVDFVLGPITLGAWLYYEGDLDRSSKLTNDPVSPPIADYGGTQHPVQVGQDALGTFIRVGLSFH